LVGSGIPFLAGRAMNNTRRNEIERFFNAYEKRFNDSLAGLEPDVDGTVNSFAECFVEASPAGIICGKNDRKFRKAVPKGNEFYKSIGTQSMTIKDREITVIDDLHAMVKIHWHSVYKKNDNAEVIIEFDVHYLIQQKENGIKIFAYITGDEQKALKENGLI
jgi:hypothetical protein